MTNTILDMPLDGPHTVDTSLQINAESNDKQIQPIDLSIPRGKWTEAHFKELAQKVTNGVHGEELMQLCGLKRRDTLKAIWADAYEKGMLSKAINWEFNSNCGARAIPSKLKIMKDGALRISKAQFDRLKFNIAKEDKFKLEKSDENTLVLKRIAK